MDERVVLDLLARALELDGSARRRFVAEISDSIVRSRLESLLRHVDDPDSFLDRSPAAYLRGQWLGVRLPMLLGSFLLESEIESASLTSVYRGHSVLTGDPAAIKVLHPLLRTPELLGRFRREVELLDKLGHDQIARVVGSDLDGEVAYIATAWIEGPTLRSLVPARDALPTGTEVRGRAEFVASTARAVHEAHRMGVIHRDLKPENVVVRGSSEGGVPIIIDFNMATLFEEPGVGLTQRGHVVGTPSYMSPEQSRGESVDARTDVWSLGVILFEMLCGALPFRGDTPAAMRRAIENEPFDPPRSLNPNVSSALETIIMVALSKDRSRRYHSAAALATDLDRVTRGDRPRARRPGYLWKASRWIQRNPAFTSAVGVALIALLYVRFRSGVPDVEGGQQRTEQAEEHGFTRGLVAAVVADALVDDRGGRPTTEGLKSLARVEDWFEFARVAKEAGSNVVTAMLRASYLRLKGTLLVRLGEVEAARECREAELEMRRHFLSSLPDARSEFAIATVQVGDLLNEEGRLEAASARYLEALSIDETCHDDDPVNPTYLDNLCHSHGRVAEILGRLGALDLRDKHLVRQYTLCKKLRSIDPNRVESMRASLQSTLQLIDCLIINHSDPSRIAPYCDEALQLSEKLIGQSRADRDARVRHANALRLSSLAATDGDRRVDFATRAVEAWADLSRSDSNVHEYAARELEARAVVVWALAKSGRRDESVSLGAEVECELRGLLSAQGDRRPMLHPGRDAAQVLMEACDLLEDRQAWTRIAALSLSLLDRQEALGGIAPAVAARDRIAIEVTKGSRHDLSSAECRAILEAIPKDEVSRREYRPWLAPVLRKMGEPEAAAVLERELATEDRTRRERLETLLDSAR